MEADIYREMKKMHHEFERVMDAFRWDTGWPLVERKEMEDFRGFRFPIAHLKETKDKIIAAIEVPGVDKEDIELNVTPKMVEIRAESKSEKEEKEKGRYEFRSSQHKFYRKLPLPVEVKADQAIGNYKNGMLTVEMPKAAVITEQPKKRIEIK